MFDAVAPMLALYQPDIPQNAGTLLRTCACLNVAVAIIGPAGFPTSDRHFRRAGMDYLDHVDVAHHASFESFQGWRNAEDPPHRLVLLSTSAETSYLDAVYHPGDIFDGRARIGWRAAGRACSGGSQDRHTDAVADAVTQCGHRG